MKKTNRTLIDVTCTFYGQKKRPFLLILIKGRKMWVALCVLMGFLGASVTSLGMIVNDPANTWQNALTAVRSLEQLSNQATQIKNQLESYQLAKQNSNSITDYQWRDISNLTKDLQHIQQQGQGISATSANHDTQFRNAYPTYGQSVKGRKYSDQYKQWNNTTMDSIRNTLKSAGFIMRQFDSEQHVLATLKRQGETAQGRMQVLQVSTAIASEQVNQLQSLKQIQTAQMNSQNAYMAYKVSQDAHEQESLGLLVNNMDDNFPDYQPNAELGKLPHMP